MRTVRTHDDHCASRQTRLHRATERTLARLGRLASPRGVARRLLAPACALLIAGCGGDGAEQDAAAKVPPSTYSFVGRDGTTSSVSYTGQTHRQVLMRELGGWIGGLTKAIDGGKAMKAGDVEAGCDFYYRYDASVGADTVIALTTSPATLQQKLGDISSKNLEAKLAGKDPTGQRKDWSKELVGWPGQPSADGLVRHWFQTLDAAAVARSQGKIGTAPDGSPLKFVHVSAEGRNYEELIAKFLGVAISFDQAMDDYLDDDLPGKGLRSDHTKPEKAGAPYTTLEHAWDEAFGYFGAARDYGDYSDDEIAGKGGRDGWKGGYHDTDGDGKIDLRAEFNFGHATNAAKRDRGAKGIAPVDLTKAAFDAFLAGRHLLATTKTTLTAAQFKELQGYRDAVAQAWEQAISATMVHYLNEVLQDIAAFDTKDYDFYAQAKHWSELKGFALGLQFNPRSPLSAAQFVELHQLIGDKPVLPTAGKDAIATYKKATISAKKLLGDAYGFDAKLLGDDAGKGGW